MNAECRRAWRCHRCRQSAKSETKQVPQKSKGTASSSLPPTPSLKKDKAGQGTSSDVHVHTVQSDVSELKADSKEIMRLISDLSAKFEKSQEDLRQEFFKTTLQYENTITELKSQVADLREKCDKQTLIISRLEHNESAQQQQSLIRNVVIRNIDKRDNENFSAIVERIAAIADVNIAESDIDDVYRENRKQGNIVVKFCRTTKKSEFIKKTKGKKLSAGAVLGNGNGAGKYVHVNDQLTAYNRYLLWAAKNKAKACGWKFVWVKEGKVLYIFIPNQTSIS
ncbi:uncharacterized protein [Eurosta solidaginis]|uniref:uncharacterized protein isoform X2 n=1 Tax=Eurosta solidaginis TaxID=178769 RepID=UPI0035315C4F